MEFNTYGDESEGKELFVKRLNDAPMKDVCCRLL